MRLGRETPLPTPLGAFGASILAPSALSFCGRQCKILATPLERAFWHVGPTAWNSLPPDTRAAASPAMLKKLVNTHFLT